MSEILDMAHSMATDLFEAGIINNDTMQMMDELCFEGVQIKTNTHMAAFIVAVAEAYDAAPVFAPKDRKYWDILIKHTKLTLFKRLQGTNVKVIFEKDDPYDKYGDAAMKFMMYDIVVNHRLQIYTGFSDNHPTFSENENVIFRAVHDFFTHATVRKSFMGQLKAAAKQLRIAKLPELDKAGPLLELVSLPSHSFTPRGEFNAASDHVRMAPKAAAPAIFTEVTGQVCYFTIVGDFPVQKTAVLHGFDYGNIGKCIRGSQAEARVNEVMALIEQGEDQISLKIKAKPAIKTADLIAVATRRG